MGAVTAARAVSRAFTAARAARHASTAACAASRVSGVLRALVTAVALSVSLTLVTASPLRSQPADARAQLPPKDAGPLRTETPLTEVRERMRSGDIDGALSALDALSPDFAQRPAMRYLRARLYEDKDRVRDALDSLPDDLSTLPGLIARDVQIRRALWLARIGRCSEARPMLISLAKYDGPDAELTLRAADCALVQADAASALVLLRDVRGAGAKRFGVRLTLAKVLALTADTTAALRELKALYVEFPEHSRMSEVEAQLRELVPEWEPSNEEHFDRAEHWLDAAQPESALTELELIQLPKPQSRRERFAQLIQLGRIAHLKGMALFRMRTRYAEAAHVLTQAASMDTTTRTADAYHAAQALARADLDADAVRAYRAFAKRYPKDPLTADALHDAAWLELRHDMPGGEARMRTLLHEAEQRGVKRTVTEALWDLAIHAFSNQHCDRGLALFERYATMSEAAMIKARGLYWAGRCAVLLGKRELGLQHFRAALAVEPLHWYALLAKEQISALGEDSGPPFGQASTASATAIGTTAAVRSAIPLPPAVAFYADLGLVDDAINTLRQQETALREGRDDDGLPLLVAAYHSLGEYTRPYHLAERERDDVLLREPKPAAQPIWEALFPKPYAREVVFAAKAAALPPELVFAVIRKESAFNPSVVSSADAIGLMQLIERTAKSNAQDLGIAHFDRSMLYEPGTNVLLGSHYLAKLLARYRGQAVPAIAAYNAGEHRVDPWLKRAAKPDKTIDVDWFVEDIPIDQTRNYVRRVVCSWARYRYLEKPTGWPLSLSLTLKL
jgi:soluble lytic murein transglycosylase